MHGLINRSVERFLVDCYGEAVWQPIAQQIGHEHFESMLSYDDDVTHDLIALAATTLGKPAAAVLEDLGMHLVRYEPLRRLLRFGGVDYADFLLSLNELHDRGKLAVAELELPVLTVDEREPGCFLVEVEAAIPGWTQVLAGLLRAMADDYGALVLLEEMPAAPAVCGHDHGAQWCGCLTVRLLQARYAEGRQFQLAGLP